MLVTAKQVVGAVAQAAVRQSPYPTPYALESVLNDLYHMIRADFDTLGIMKKFKDWRDLEKYLSPKLRSLPQYMAWNERANGNPAPFQFVTRYDAPGDPANDFIDLDALERNVVMAIEREERQNA